MMNHASLVRSLSFGFLALCACSAKEAPRVGKPATVSESPVPEDRLASEVAERFGAAVSCGPDSRDPQRAWCPVLLVGESSFESLDEPVAYLGFATALQHGAPPDLHGSTDLAVLYLSPGGVRLTALRPSSTEEEQQLGRLAFALAAVLKEAGSEVEIGDGLASFLDREAAKPGYPYRIDDGVAIFRGKLESRLYRVRGGRYGDAYVVIESAAGGQFVSVFPAVTPRRP